MLPPGGVHAKHFQPDNIICSNLDIVLQMHREYWALRGAIDNTGGNGHGNEDTGNEDHDNEDHDNEYHGNEDHGEASPELPEKNIKAVDNVTDFDTIWDAHDPDPYWTTKMVFSHGPDPLWSTIDIPPSPPRPPLTDEERQEIDKALLLCECPYESEEDEEAEEEPRPAIIFDGSMLPISSQIGFSHPLVPPIA